MDTYGEPSSLYFYPHLPFIYETRVLVPFTYFEIYFWMTINSSLLLDHPQHMEYA